MEDKKTSLTQLIGNRSAFSVLQHLCMTDGGESGRRIAQLVGLSHPVVNKTLSQLEAHGLVIAKPIGRAYAYTINREHLLIQRGLQPLFTTATQWLEIVGTYYLEHLSTRPVSIVLFGSLARNTARPSSDMDLLFLYPPTARSMDCLAEISRHLLPVYRMCGHSPAPVVMITDQFRKEVAEKVGLARTIAQEGLVIAGAMMTEVLTP